MISRSVWSKYVAPALLDPVTRPKSMSSLHQVCGSPCVGQDVVCCVKRLRLLIGEAETAGAASGLRGARRQLFFGASRRELLANDAEREIFVALQAQDRAQARYVVLCIDAVATLGALRSEELLVFEVADFGDRDVAELLLQGLAHGADCECLSRGTIVTSRRPLRRWPAVALIEVCCSIAINAPGRSA